MDEEEFNDESKESESIKFSEMFFYTVMKLSMLTVEVQM